MFVNKTHEKAHEALKNGDIQKAIQLYSKALEDFPKDCNLLSDRGVAYLHANDKVKCYADFDSALMIQPNYSYRYASRAFAKNNFGDIDGAIEDYEKAVELDPDDAIAHNNLGLLLEQKGYKRASEERFERADKLSKNEDHLLEMMDDLENDKCDENKNASDATPIDPSIVRDRNLSTASELKKVFTSKSQFMEFMNFIKNGFKIK